MSGRALSAVRQDSFKTAGVVPSDSKGVRRAVCPFIPAFSPKTPNYKPVVFGKISQKLWRPRQHHRTCHANIRRQHGRGNAPAGSGVLKFLRHEARTQNDPVVGPVCKMIDPKSLPEYIPQRSIRPRTRQVAAQWRFCAHRGCSGSAQLASLVAFVVA